MLLKVKYQGTKKYIRLQSGFTYLEFINEVKSKFGLPDATDLQIFDETDTAVDEDILLELIESNPDLCLTVCDSFSVEDHSSPSSLTDTMSPSSSDNDLSSRRERGIPIDRNVSNFEVMNRSTTEASGSEAAKEMVENALLRKPGGEDVLEEYKSENTLTHSTRRHLVNILTSHMTEMHGRIVPRQQKEKYALGIITLFPSLKDPFSPKGYEHFYDGVKNTGFLSWRLRTMSRKNRATGSPQAGKVPQLQGPKRQRPAATDQQQLDGDACREAISFLVHSPDEAGVFEKMKLTLQHRQDLLNQDFLLLFGGETASKMLEKWDTAFKYKVIKEAKQLTQSKELCRLLNAAEKPTENDDTSWDSDMASLLLLLHLLPPTAGRRGAKSVPVMQWKKWFTFTSRAAALMNTCVGERVNNPATFRCGKTFTANRCGAAFKWKAATIPHTVQQDSTSCGVFVMQMAKEAIQSFPAIPSFNMKNSPRAIGCLRAEMAEELLSASEKDYCSICGLHDVPRDTDIEAVVIDWTQCDSCGRWFHDMCLTAAQMEHVPQELAQWQCTLCDNQ
ncbi:unnamed protein product [Gadus morhua 'NCC']